MKSTTKEAILTPVGWIIAIGILWLLITWIGPIYDLFVPAHEETFTALDKYGRAHTIPFAEKYSGAGKRSIIALAIVGAGSILYFLIHTFLTEDESTKILEIPPSVEPPKTQPEEKPDPGKPYPEYW